MKYIKLFENFQDNLEDIKWALTSAYDTSDFKIMTRSSLEDQFVVITIQDDDKENNEISKSRFLSLLSDVDDYNSFWTEMVYYPREKADTVIILVKGELSDVLYRNFGFNDRNGYINYIKSRAKEIGNKWVNIGDIIKQTGSYDFNFKMNLYEDRIYVELEEGSQIIIDGEIFDLKKCISDSNSDLDWEITTEISELIITYLVNNDELNLIRMYYKSCDKKFNFFDEGIDELVELVIK
jgi:hypothetical protein